MSADVFAPLRERVEFAAKWDATTVKLDQDKIMLLDRLLREHAALDALATHLETCLIPSDCPEALKLRWAIKELRSLSSSPTPNVGESSSTLGRSSSPHPTDNQ